MKHLALIVSAFMASTLPGMATNIHVGSSLDGEHIAALAIIMIFGLPIFITALVLYFANKNKQAKYKLASEALAAGKEIPQDLFKDNAKTSNEDTLKKGIRNVFLGIGLGVFLWVLTYEEGIAAIGFLLFCIGLGQVITAYATRPKETSTNTDIERL